MKEVDGLTYTCLLCANNRPGLTEFLLCYAMPMQIKAKLRKSKVFCFLYKFAHLTMPLLLLCQAQG